MRAFIFVLVLGLATSLQAQIPILTAVVNAASNLLPGLPNSAVAQGSLMVLYGTGLGPATLVSISNYPLPTALGGTSVKIAIGGKTIDALVYYSSATQAAAIVPSITPTGTGAVTVTYNGSTSASIAVSVLRNNVGLYTVNSQGTGGAVVTFADYSYLSPTNAANPGDTVILWANGLGPIQGDDAQRPITVDMTDVPLEVYIGGRPAPVLFRGRNSCCASLDQINIQIPAGVAGCVTPIVLKIGSLVSNTAMIPLAPAGRRCTNNDPAGKDGDLQSFIGKSRFVLGQVALLRSTILSPGSGTGIRSDTSDDGSAFFTKFTSPNLYALGSAVDLPPSGSCAILAGPNASAFTGVPTAYLDAGAAITLNGPNGLRTYPKSVYDGNILYFGNPVTGYLEGGPYMVTGPGGPDIGAFTANLNFPKSFTWINQATYTSVTRANGLTVSWVGGEGLVQISGQSTVATSATTSISARFDCVAKATDGTFTIPPAVLLSLPATGTALGTLTVGNIYNRVPFSATGVDRGFIYFGASGLNLGIVEYR